MVAFLASRVSAIARRPRWLAVERRLEQHAPLARRVGTVLLVVWFAWQTYQRLSVFVRLHFPVGIDAMIYHRGVVAWLGGTNPWDASVMVHGYHYAGTPMTTVLMAPIALLSEEAFAAAWIAATWIAVIWTLRRLGFPLWWLLFPPLAEGLFSANPQLIVLALLVANRSIASAAATVLKVYAFVPLFGEARWRQIAFAVALNAVTVLIAPGLFVDYFRQFGAISRRLAIESTMGTSAFYFPALLAVTVVALLILALRDRRAAGWLAVPAVWPSSHFHYATMALPVMSPLLAVMLASPMARLAPVAIILECIRRVVQPRIAVEIARRRPARDDSAPGEPMLPSRDQRAAPLP